MMRSYSMGRPVGAAWIEAGFSTRNPGCNHAMSASMPLRTLKPPHTGAFLEPTGPLADLGTKFGLMPRQRIKALIANRKLVQAAEEIEDSQIQPSSLDLRLGAKRSEEHTSELQSHS